MPRFEDPLASLETKIIRPVRGVDGRYAYAGIITDSTYQDDAPHHKLTVDARPGMTFASVATYWFDPDSVGRSPETIFFTVNPAPTKTTSGTRYDQILYYRFTVGTGSNQKTYQYKKRLTYLKNVNTATPDQPWVPSSDEDGPLFLVNFQTNQLVDKRGISYIMEPVI
jgi:hypothetical protein